MRDSFTMKRKFWEAISDLPRSRRLEAYEALMGYAFTGAECEVSPAARAAMRLIKDDIDLSRKRAAAGRKGGLRGKGATERKPVPEDAPRAGTNTDTGETGPKETREAKDPEDTRPGWIYAKDIDRGISQGITPAATSMPYEDEIGEMKTNSQWAEVVCMENHVTLPTLHRYLDRFHAHVKMTMDGIGHPSIGDAHRHFVSWLRKAIGRDGNGKGDDAPEKPDYTFRGNI